jgi:hypothetical protein
MYQRCDFIDCEIISVKNLLLFSTKATVLQTLLFSFTDFVLGYSKCDFFVCLFEQ